MTEQLLTMEQKKNALAEEIWKWSRDSIAMHLRFLDGPLARMKWEPEVMAELAAWKEDKILYSPDRLLTVYKADGAAGVRLLLHMLMHMLFHHNFGSERLIPRIWNLASDMAAEAVVLELELPQAAGFQDEEELEELKKYREKAGGSSAERLYQYFKYNPLSFAEEQRLMKLFAKDSHKFWAEFPVPEEMQEEWKKQSQKVRTDQKAFSKGKKKRMFLEEQLGEAMQVKTDYASLLRRFTASGEEMRISEDEFDMMYYTYGLQTYGNLPLIEPQEFREASKVRDFVIVIDVSGSCRGEIVKGFLNQTWSLLKREETFFEKMNVHILQCDNQVTKDTAITGEEDLKRYFREEKITGFGATDFRPAFDYVDRLLAEGAFDRLKGMIYFTDGLGIYPEQMPGYDVIFAFPGEDANRPPVPVWAITAVLDRETLEIEGLKNEETEK